MTLEPFFLFSPDHGRFFLAGQRVKTRVTITDQSTSALPAAVTKAYDLLLWLIGHVENFRARIVIHAGDWMNFAPKCHVKWFARTHILCLGGAHVGLPELLLAQDIGDSRKE